MTSKPGSAVRLATDAPSAIKSKVRTEFNALINKLEVERKRLAAWHDAMPKMRARADVELMPLGERYDQCQRDMVILFDAACTHKQIGKKEREKLSDLICGMALGLLEMGEDEELAEIYARHSGADELADDPEFLAFSHMLDKMMQDGMDRAFPEDGPGFDEESGVPSKGVGKAASRKASAHAARQAEEEARLMQSVRDIFRKLASALHPDRETDGAERERKTGLMQRANVAYAANDLLGLLELQFEVDQIDASKLDSLGEARIKQYNKVLSKQVAEVRREINELEHWLMHTMHIAARGRVTPALMEKALTGEINQFKVKIAGIEQDLRDFKDVRVLKAFLKTYRIAPPFEFMEEDYY